MEWCNTNNYLKCCSRSSSYCPSSLTEWLTMGISSMVYHDAQVPIPDMQLWIASSHRAATVSTTKAEVALVHAFVSSRLNYWFTVMRYCMVTLMGCTVAYSPSRMPQWDLYPGYGAVITSGQPYYVSTGCLYDREYCSRSMSWSTNV